MDSLKNKALILKGIDKAKEVQKQLVETGISIIEKNQLKSHKRFRYVILGNDNLI